MNLIPYIGMAVSAVALIVLLILTGRELRSIPSHTEGSQQ